MKNILILGVNSYVGYNVARGLMNSHKVTGVSRKKIPSLDKMTMILEDSTEVGVIDSLVKCHNISVVINCVCMGNVDQCEKEKELAHKLNYQHVQNLAGLSKRLNFKLIHFSSNAVYDGDHPTYGELSPKKPKNFYGAVKAQADDFIKENLTDYLLLRVMTLYGNKEPFQRHNPASMIIDNLKDNKPLKLVDDLYGNLFFIDDLVNFVFKALENNFSGEFNLSGNEIVQRHELGTIIAEIMHKPSSLLTACSSEDFPSLAPRAYNTSFDNSKVKAVFPGPITPIRDGIKKTVERMMNGNH